MIELKLDEESLQIILSAELDNLDRADTILQTCLDILKLPIDQFGLRILFREAALNAVTHGSGLDRGKHVIFTMNMDNEGVTMSVQDSGPGFDWKACQEQPDSLDESGRGLELMRIYADNVQYNEKGNVVTMRKVYKVKTNTSR